MMKALNPDQLRAIAAKSNGGEGDGSEARSDYAKAVAAALRGLGPVRKRTLAEMLAKKADCSPGRTRGGA